MLALLSSLVLLPALGALAAPAPAARSAADVTTLTAAQLSSLAPYTQFARAAYCDPSIVTGWQCGEACDAVTDFTATLTGGDGDETQFYYVGYWSTQKTVVVAHQGTDPTQLVSVLTDVDIPTIVPDPTLFPGLPSDIEVHEGFANEQAKTAALILAEVKRLLAQYSASSVTLVGHSLGGALAELDSLYMHLNLPASVAIQAVTYGTPRVGNDAWAAYFDSQITNFKRVNNEKDIVPIVPGRFLGFSHVAGEVHIVSPGDAVSCPGDDDATDDQCTIQTVPNIFDGDILDHLGPYEGIYIGTIYCT
ncbi:alpha/beta-hydrolase [Heliocybe sulcata]|uniref:Alpha/beta-hydrolase n=1 Tax=Heliocybe sulcata TaxID=5364 RepID=A0A5C3MT68_9AGAM|nr:alpha/beta-hydrolase [Heliocybe sulcata]